MLIIFVHCDFLLYRFAVWSRVNDVFEYLPIAAVIGDKVLCIHGGIGDSIETLDDLRGIPKPIKVCGDVTAEMSRQEKVFFIFEYESVFFCKIAS